MLSGGKVNAIGVATAEPLAYFFDDPYARRMMAGISEVCDANGIGISLVSAATEDELAWSIKSALVDGLILFCLEDAERLVAAARERRLPFVALDLGDTDDDVPAVGIDDVAGARLAARHLAELGHRRFAIIAMEFGAEGSGRVTMERVEAATYATSRARVQGYFEALAAFGVDTEAVPIYETTDGRGDRRRGAGGDLRRPGAADGAPRPVGPDRDAGARVAQGPRPRRARATSRSSASTACPKAAATDPPLTTVRQPIGAIGRRAVEIIIEQGEEVRREALDVDLVVRASTAPPAS